MITLETYTEGGLHPVEVSFWTFPAGERGCKIVGADKYVDKYAFKISVITMQFKGSDDLIDLMLLTNAIRELRTGATIILVANYFPYARQDRVMTKGEAFSLKVIVDMIVACKFFKVEVLDPHSDVLSSLFPPGMLAVYTQAELYSVSTNLPPHSKENTYLVAPDAGALKKTQELAVLLGLPVIEASKVRDPATGQITGTSVSCSTQLPDAPIDLIVVDDIIDGGRTFIELAKVLKSQYNVSTLSLWATHGIFSKGREVLSDYDNICVINNMEA